MSITATREFGFDMGHMLPDHEGGCYRPHGHRYRLAVTVTGEVLGEGPEAGMVIDFGRLKQVVQEVVIDWLDHRFMVSHTDPRCEAMVAVFADGSEHDDTRSVLVESAPPTAENLARWIGNVLRSALRLHDIELVEVRLWETPTCSAEWRP